jgi:hypothetical protein
VGNLVWWNNSEQAATEMQEWETTTSLLSSSLLSSSLPSSSLLSQYRVCEGQHTIDIFKNQESGEVILKFYRSLACTCRRVRLRRTPILGDTLSVHSLYTLCGSPVLCLLILVGGLLQLDQFDKNVSATRESVTKQKRTRSETSREKKEEGNQ